jgi:hypothetical protein
MPENADPGRRGEYPPDLQRAAVDLVIKQAELMAVHWG